MDWISIKDRLPKDGELVLLYGVKEGCGLYSVGHILHQNEQWYDAGDGWCWLGNNNDSFTGWVTHWALLPEKPNISQKEKKNGYCYFTKR